MTEPFIAPFNGQRVPISETLKAEIIELTEGRCVLRYPFLPEFANPMGQLQGGMYAVMMDSAMALAANGIATVAMQFSIFRPVTSGWMTVTGEVVKRGRRVVFAEAEVRDESGALIARGTQNGLPRD